MKPWLVPIVLAVALAAQQPQSSPEKQTQTPTKPEHKISKAEADALFKSVDEIMSFASADTGMPIHGPVKRKLVSRDEVEKMLIQRMAEDKDAQRFERSELILKKFGMLPPDFHLKPLLIRLLKEQIAGFYDVKEKTINLLDWLPSESQRLVLAHELTHALQDQQIDLDKWGDEPDSQDVKNEYNKGIRSDEASLARASVTEGQAMVVTWDYVLSAANKTLLDAPEFANRAQELAASSEGGVMKEAPLVVRDSLIFPYREGFGFAFEVLKAKGKQKAFGDMLRNPPLNAHQILVPASYLDGEKQPDPKMPDLAPALKGKYPKFDSGAVGEFDIRVLLQEYKKLPAVAKSIASAWRGGMYYAGKRSSEVKNATDIALFYVSDWKDEQSAQRFRFAYQGMLPNRYPDLQKNASGWTTSAGDIRIVQQGSRVFICEGFDVQTADALIKLGGVENGAKVALDHGEVGRSYAGWAADLIHPRGLD